MSVRLGIHPSVDRLVPPAMLQSSLADDGATVSLLDGDASLGGDGASLGDENAPLDGVVTFDFEEWFLDAGLDWIHVVRAGYDEFPLPRLRDRDVALTNSTGLHGAPVGETVVGYMLQFARGLHRYGRAQTDREWRPPAWDGTFTLDGESVCVVGLGTVGQGVARRADALGMRVSGVRRTPTPVEHVRTRYAPSDLPEAVGDARFVVLATPLTDRTEGLIGRSELDAMRDDAYLVNVARGPVVDTDALVDALRAGSVAGAALDVFEEEPLPADSPLWEFPNVVLTPHAAAATEDYPALIADLVRENRRRLDAGESLANRVV